MKEKKGSIHFQIVKLFQESGIFTPGVSKHQVKILAREKGINNWKGLGEEYTIYSYGTADAYLSIWHQFGGFLRSNFSLSSVHDLDPSHVRAYLAEKIRQRVSYPTFQGQAAAIMKLQKALNMDSYRVGLGTIYDFRPIVEELLWLAKHHLEKNDVPRAYEDPWGLISSVNNESSRLAASLQYEGGTRVREIALIKEIQLSGEIIDDLTGIKMGKIHLLHCKGGLQRNILVSAKNYELLGKTISANEGIFKINTEVYRRHLIEAAKDSYQAYHGTHGLRWNWAQKRFLVCRDHGFSMNEALKKVSIEMGHRRSSITLHYLLATPF